MESSTIIHTIPPVYDRRSRVLLLGTMPSPKSRESGFFYGHPQNRFWKVVSAVLDETVPQTIPEKRDLLLRNHIALWDVYSSCEIQGADDASIRNAVPNKQYKTPVCIEFPVHTGKKIIGMPKPCYRQNLGCFI